MKNLILILPFVLLACGQSKKEVMQEWYNKQDSIAKHNSDSIEERFKLIKSLMESGFTEEESSHKVDSIMKLVK